MAAEEGVTEKFVPAKMTNHVYGIRLNSEYHKALAAYFIPS